VSQGKPAGQGTPADHGKPVAEDLPADQDKPTAAPGATPPVDK